MAIALTVTAEPNYSPPRVRLDLTASAGEAQASILRIDPDGRYRRVRTADDGPLPFSGGVATAYDYEVPFGSPVTYIIEEGPATAIVTLDSAVPWLTHLGVPSRSRAVDFRVGTNDEETWDLDQGVFAPLEREFPIVATGGPRVAPVSRLVLYTETAAGLAALRDLFADGSILLLNVPPSLGLGLNTCYVAFGRAQVRRLSTVGNQPQRDIEVPYRVVARPAGGTQAAITWNDVAEAGASDYAAAFGSKYASWQAITDAGVTSWASLAAPTA